MGLVGPGAQVDPYPNRMPRGEGSPGAEFSFIDEDQTYIDPNAITRAAKDKKYIDSNHRKVLIRSKT